MAEGAHGRDWRKAAGAAAGCLVVATAIALAGGPLPLVIGGGALAAFAAAILWPRPAASSRQPAVPETVAKGAGSAGNGPGLDLLVSSFPLPLVLIDDQMLVLGLSRSAQAAFPALTTGRPLSLALRDPDVLDSVGACLAGRTDAQIQLSERGVPERTWRVRLSAIKAPDLRPRVAAVFEDLTEQQALERMRVDFVANASHELRTPLASLLGFVETLQGPARNDAAARDRFLGIMREQATRMARLIDDLLSLSRAELRAHQIPKERIDLTAIAREIVDSLSLSARERGVHLDLNVPQAPVWIAGDRDDLLRLAENLIENAVKYGREGERVEIGVASEPEPRIEVRDFGPGIAPQHIPRLTERFYRVDVSHSREIGGTGLGLAIVKHIVARHRGRLEIESRLGEGARFKVSFPPFE